jgi:uncharacterized protein (TIGR03089 family)
VAKTANLLVDGLDAEPGDRVALDLPPHWQTAVWLFAAWSAGLHVVPRGSGEDILAVTEADLPADSTAREIVGLSLHALGMPLRQAYAGVVDYAAEVRSYGDQFVPYSPVDPDAPALTMTTLTLTGRELLAKAREAAAEWRLDEGSRVLAEVAFDSLRGLLAGLVAPLAARGSVIISLNLDKTLISRRISVEKVTAVAGAAGWNVPVGAVHRIF